MDPKRRRELALAVAAILLVAVAAWSWQRGAAPARGGNAAAGSATPNGPEARFKNPFLEVDLKALQAERPGPKEGTRNPFRFRTTPAPPPPPTSVTQQQQAAAAAARDARGLASPPPRIPLKYIGDMRDPSDPEKRIAILSDSRNAYYGREGEVIEGRYRIVRIGVESIELAYLDGRGRQTIRQTGQ